MNRRKNIAFLIVIFLIIALGVFLLFLELRDREVLERNFCTDESRNAEACIEVYQPVCGWFDPDRVKCVREPCAETFSNSCFSCMNGDVLFWTEGECPA